MQKPIRLGLIGCGGIVERTHARAYRAASETVQITALADVVPENLQKVGELFNVPTETDTQIIRRCWNMQPLMW